MSKVIMNYIIDYFPNAIGAILLLCIIASIVLIFYSGKHENKVRCARFICAIINGICLALLIIASIIMKTAFIASVFNIVVWILLAISYYRDWKQI